MEQEIKKNMKCCPIEKTLSLIGKKWCINIIRDLFDNKKKFSEFLESNKDLSTKMLSARLKELKEQGLIEKKVISTDPISIEYTLTKKGLELNKVLYELSLFSMRIHKDEIMNKNCDYNKCLNKLATHFKIKN